MPTAVDELKNIKIGTYTMPICDIGVEFLKTPAECRSRKETDRHTRLTLPDGRRFKVSSRFWNSFCSLENQGRSIFDLFSHGEVFDRIHLRKQERVRITLQESAQPWAEDDGGVSSGMLLSCTNPTKPLLPIEEAVDLVERHGGLSAEYDTGVVSATFDCPFPTPYTIAGDEFQTQFKLYMPIDGYGMPQSYLTMLREVCTNGMVGMAKAFKTQFQLGKGEDNIAEVLDRAMTTFSAEEGFHSFAQRVTSATHSWASLDEASRLLKCLNQAMSDDKQQMSRRIFIIDKFNRMCGDPLRFYGLTSREEISSRKAKTIPVNTSVYEMINFASEVATHELQRPGAKNRLNAWMGTTISAEFDLEGSKEEFGEWDSFFLRN